MRKSRSGRARAVSLLVGTVWGLSLFAGAASCHSGSSCPEPTTRVVNGCPTYLCPVVPPGGDTMGDDYTTFAAPFFTTYCVRCHSTTRTNTSTSCPSTDATCRHGAPLGFDWDDPASIRAHLATIRFAVGEENFMPLDGLQPTCDERSRLVRWIDAGAPGLP